MKFADLKFKEHPNVPGEKSIQALQFFPNGYGVSVVRFPGSYGYENGLYEVAILRGTENDYDLCYDSPITDDVLGHREELDVENIIQEVQSL